MVAVAVGIEALRTGTTEFYRARVDTARDHLRESLDVHRVPTHAERRACFDDSLRHQELIEQIAKSLVDAPDEVEVFVVEEEDAIVLELQVAESDLGKVIGKRGRTARALRTLLDAASVKLQQRFELEILE